MSHPVWLTHGSNNMRGLKQCLDCGSFFGGQTIESGWGVCEWGPFRALQSPLPPSPPGFFLPKIPPVSPHRI